VQLFFVLSGFLITPILVDMRHSLDTGYFRSFYGRRALRIFPACYLYLALMLPLSYALVDGLGWRAPALLLFQEQVGYAALYVYDFFHAGSAFQETSLLTHFWTLGVEEQIYLVWPLLVMWSGRRRLIPVLVGMALAGPALRTATWLAATQMELDFVYWNVPLAIYVLPWSHFDAFAIGGLAALLPRTGSRALFAGCWGAIAVAGFASTALATGSIGPLLALGYDLAMPHAYQFLWGYSLLNVGFALLIQRVARLSFGAALLEWRPVRYLGRISYGLYIVHYPVIFLLQASLFVWGWAPDSVAVPFLAFGFSVALAAASYRYVEAPLLARKDRLFPRARTAN
jgi:peptidoglycan/LPS O-acetylase OafA/YrhL